MKVLTSQRHDKVNFLQLISARWIISNYNATFDANPITNAVTADSGKIDIFEKLASPVDEL